MKGRAVAEALPTADVERTHAFDVGLEPLRSLGVTRQRGGPTRGRPRGALLGEQFRDLEAVRGRVILGCMATKAHDEWKVLPHGPLTQLADNLWWVWGSLPGMSLKRTMTVVRLSGERLLIYNAIALDEAGMKELDELGSPAFIVVPNGAHRLDAPAFKRRYPEARILAPKGARERVEEVVPVDLLCEEFPEEGSVRFEPLQGVGDTEGAMIVESADGVTLVLNDAMVNMDKKSDWLGYLFTTLLGSAPGPRVSRLAKLLFIKDKQALRKDFERFATLPNLQRLIVAHEKVATGPDAAAALRQAATYL